MMAPPEAFRMLGCTPGGSLAGRARFRLYPTPAHTPFRNSAGLFQCLALGCDARYQVAPGLVKRLGAVALELGGEGVDVDARTAEAVQHLLTAPATGRQQVAEPAVV